MTDDIYSETTPMKLIPGQSKTASLPPNTDTDPTSGASIEYVTDLLRQLNESSGGDTSPTEAAKQDRLVESRLGGAASLFTALRCKHTPTAGHSLRVALACSGWGLAMKLDEQSLGDLEISALLHDVGKIGVSEQVLLKPGALLQDEAALMDQHRKMGLDILQSCGASEAALEIVHYIPAWYDGSRTIFDRQGDALPLGARMIAITDAFDAMTTDHVYRPAMSRERALKELCECAATQFDPKLVQQFVRMHEHQHPAWEAGVARRWLQRLPGQSRDLGWRQGEVSTEAHSPEPANLFHDKLLENMCDAVVYVNASLRIASWNRSAERLTGIAASSVIDRTWSPSLFDMHDKHGVPVTDAQCPAAYVIRGGVQALRRATIAGRDGMRVSVDLQAIPVTASDGTTHGAALVLHDVSSQATLEQRCQDLHERATKDGLTQVANRAEFDRVHTLFVDAHLERNLPCSMFICDIDRFKSINDKYGHPVGDTVIRTFGQLLKGFCRPGDLVARYGGEEFVVLCADCNNAIAAKRADQVREAFGRLEIEELDGNRVTASFGVTEIQAGDTPETMLARADRALLQAKDTGRNRVIQLGSADTPKAERRSWWWTRRGTPNLLLEQELLTPVPLKLAIEKLRGLVADHGAHVSSIDGTHVQLRINSSPRESARWNSPRTVAFLIDATFSEDQAADSEDTSDKSAAGFAKTRIHIEVRLHKNRDQRRSDAEDQANNLLVSFRSYLMAVIADKRRTTDRRSKSAMKDLLRPWVSKSENDRDADHGTSVSGDPQQGDTELS
jgi:diguanylate cyclase (GGDEF)-like protein/PAS domain S-box-containing protein